MIIVHSGEPRTPEEQLRDEIEVLSAELYNTELRLASLQNNLERRKHRNYLKHHHAGGLPAHSPYIGGCQC